MLTLHSIRRQFRNPYRGFIDMTAILLRIYFAIRTMLGLNLDTALVLVFVIFCYDCTVAGSKRKDLSRSLFTQSLDLVSVLQLSLRKNNDDYKDNPPENIDDAAPTSTRNTDSIDLHIEDSKRDGNYINFARRLNDKVGGGTTNFVEKVRMSLVKENTSHDKLDEKNSQPKFMTSLEEIKIDSNKKSEEEESKYNKRHSKLHFMKSNEELKTVSRDSIKKRIKSKRYFIDSLEKIKIENKNLNKYQEDNETKSDEKQSKYFRKSHSRYKFRRSQHAKSQEIRSKLYNAELELTTLKDPWLEVINPYGTKLTRTHETPFEPYLLGKETTTRLKYKVLTVKRSGDYRRGGVPHFLQTELKDRGVVVAPLDLEGPMPDFKLPKSRSQFRVDSDDEEAEANSAVSGDDDALVPR